VVIANEERLRQSVKITRTPRDKGWQATIKLAVYDEGTVGLNDLPLNPNPSQDQDVAEARMAPALEVVVDEFMRQVRQQHVDPA
jgi:hypothetical protein